MGEQPISITAQISDKITMAWSGARAESGEQKVANLEVIEKFFNDVAQNVVSALELKDARGEPLAAARAFDVSMSYEHGERLEAQVSRRATLALCGNAIPQTMAEATRLLSEAHPEAGMPLFGRLVAKAVDLLAPKAMMKEVIEQSFYGSFAKALNAKLLTEFASQLAMGQLRSALAERLSLPEGDMEAMKERVAAMLGNERPQEGKDKPARPKP